MDPSPHDLTWTKGKRPEVLFSTWERMSSVYSQENHQMERPTWKKEAGQLPLGGFYTRGNEGAEEEDHSQWDTSEEG